MNKKGEAQFGWGTPVNLNPANADMVRELVEDRISKLNPTSQDYVSYLALRDILLPISAECDSLKDAIISSCGVLENLAQNPTPNSREITNFNVASLNQLFISRHSGCKMILKGDIGVDYYDCDKCNFCAQIEH